jgi:hypothetical protein
MLLVDKQNVEQRLIVTVSENTKVTTPSYSMLVHSDFTNETFNIDLPDSTSLYPDRYDEFLINTTEFESLQPGHYSYTITEQTDGVVEKGVLMVIDTIPDQFSFIEGDETADDYMVYDPNN